MSHAAQSAFQNLNLEGGSKMPTVLVPFSIRAAFALWLVAIAAGVFETLLVVGEMIGSRSGSVGEIALGVTVRVGVFAAAMVTALWMRRGRSWARMLLALGLGVVGTASLVAEPIRKLLQGEALGAAFSPVNGFELVFGVSRALHVSAVLLAVVLMFFPSANSYFRKSRAAVAVTRT